MRLLFLKTRVQLLLLALIISASSFITAQDNIAVDVKRNFPIGLRVGLHNDFFSNTSENDFIEYEYKDRVTFTAGFEFELLKKKRFLFTAGLFIKNISQVRSYNFTAEQLGRDRGLQREFFNAPYWTYHLPMEVLYELRKSFKTPLFIKAGLEFQYYGYTSGRYRQPFLIVNDITRIIGEYEEYQSPITFGMNAGLAGDIYLKDDSKFRWALTGHYHFQTMEEILITSTNLTVPGATSTHKWTGHYVNISLTFFPKKGFISF
ncbi:MAG: hypothetical protein WBG46_04525 [Nonlabens sp.]